MIFIFLEKNKKTDMKISEKTKSVTTDELSNILTLNKYIYVWLCIDCIKQLYVRSNSKNCVLRLVLKL